MADQITAWLEKEVKPTVDARIKTVLADGPFSERLWYTVD